MLTAWHKLPFEVLTYIFEHNIDTNNRYIQARKDLYNYQLVCKGWSKAAQSLLYRRISCQDGSVEDELQRFVQFIYTIKVLAPHVGVFVKTITVCNHLDRLEAPLTALDAIFNTCPKLVDFYCNGSSKEVAWPYLLTLPDTRLSSIRSIIEDKDTCNYSPLYPFIAFKLRKSLTKLHYAEINPASSWPSIYLLDNLSQFVSLQELYLLECKFESFSQLFKVIDKCSSTVSKLSIRQYLPLRFADPPTTGEVPNPNYSIRELSIDRGIMDSISYFAAKFKNLQKLTMNQVAPLHMIGIDWTRALADLCSPLVEYRLCFNLVLEEGIKDWSIDLIKSSSPKDTFLIIDYIGEHEEDPYTAQDDIPDSSQGILLIKNGTRSGIEVSLPWIGHGEDDIDADYDYHTHWFDNYSPNHITIKHIGVSGFLKSESFPVATTPTEFATSLRDIHRHELVEAKNWTIMARSLFSTVNTAEAIVSFSDMIIPNLNGRTSYFEKSSSSPNVKQLTFANSILYHQVLPIISNWLPTLDTLIFDTCFILMEEPYTLRINLQETKLRRLRIVAGPLTFAHGLPHGAAVARSQLKNTDLVSALSPGKQFSLKIEANKKIYSYNGKTLSSNVKSNTGPPIDNRDQADCYGTSDNFRIWIQCKELEELAIVDGTDNGRLKLALHFD
ncbi:hypothetical protein MAM1_0037d02706 [Mucor ambiguus]|uniref:F-box domain-containing protein n=1 Tax=Mucor ambiguus TaxID=91626 RepID=A0A0C9M870_9FUNG|nr:hypothetical protein MAM1_0037d02706 [Mucor ambiguus]